MLVDSVHLSFGERTVLQSVYLTAEKGKVTGVLGRNGSGKSCLFRCIMGALKPLNMFVRFGDEMKTDYAHIGERVRFLPQYQFSPAKMTLGEAFRLYGVDMTDLSPSMRIITVIRGRLSLSSREERHVLLKYTWCFAQRESSASSMNLSLTCHLCMWRS
ncbi:MAG: ATP-binding cassette domain-containing protein [Bacteroidales bacterium]|nr:ATP-binding cassette domain-containing protein [Bacteroidales bacterium]